MIVEMKEGEIIRNVKRLAIGPNEKYIHIHFKDRSGYRVVDPDKIKSTYEGEIIT